MERQNDTLTGGSFSTTTSNFSIFIFSFLLLFIHVNVSNAQCYSAPTYCLPTATSIGSYSMGIQNVTLNTVAAPTQINNSTGSGTGSPIYFDYTSQVLTAGAGVVVNYSIKVGAGNSTTFRIYIDYNNDGTFATTAPELVYTSTTGLAVNTIVTGTFTIPVGQAAGIYRIRIASDGLTNIPTPCGPTVYSAEFEDYTLLVPSPTIETMSTGFSSPASFISGNNTIGIAIKNFSSVTLTSIDIGYQLGSNTPVYQSLTGLSVAPGATYNATFTTLLAIPATGAYSMRAWSTNPNGFGSVSPSNDTTCRSFQVYCSGPLSGTYTINPAGSGTTNFLTFGAADSAMMSCGISGPVVFNVTNSTYTERLIFPAITGASATNTITFNGNGSTIQYNCDAANYSVIRLQAGTYYKFNNLTIKPLNATYAWGIHFYTNADYNTFNGCTIDFALVTGTATSTAGIVFSNSLSSATTTGANGKYDTIINCYVKGHPTTGGPYYGITLCPQASAATVSNNKLINNIIENVYVYGLYMYYTNGTLLKNNIFRNPTRTSVTTVYNIYAVNGSQKDTLWGNTFTNPYGGVTTTTNTYYGVYAASTNTPVGSDFVMANNKFYNIQSSGSVYGFYISSSTNFKIYHNSFCFDHAASAVTNAYQTVALFHNGLISGNGLDVRNNIFNITRSGTSFKYAVNLSVAGTLYNFNNNVYNVSGANSYVGYYLSNYQTFLDWRSANSGIFDAASINIFPNFLSPSTGDLTPQEGFINNKGANLSSIVGIDFIGATRTTTPDPGAYEFTPTISVDAGVNSVVIPVAPFAAGVIPINVTIRNSGLTTITSATVNWTFNGVPQTPFSWIGSLSAAGVSSNILLGTVNYTTGVPVNITAWTTNPNTTTDPNNSNDTAYLINSFCAVSAGTYTLNAGAAASSSNFQSFTVLKDACNRGGISGPITVNVVPGSGPYTEQIMFNVINGASATNKITINGNGNILQANPDASNCFILMLNGTDNMNINGLTIKTLNVTYGIGILLSNHADSNVIENNTIDFTNLGTSSTNAFIAFSGSTNSVTTSGTTHNGIRNIIRNNILKGNAAGGPYYGITNMGGSSEYTSVVQYNQFVGNDMRDPYVYSYYLQYGYKNLYSGNRISMPTRTTTTTFYGFYNSSIYYGDTIEKNQIYDIYKATPTNTNTMYGMYFSSAAYGSTTAPEVVRNNVIYNIKGQGVQYGFYGSSSYYLNFYHNTIVLDDPTATTASATYGLYFTGTATTNNFAFRNNLVYVNRGGTGSKYCIYIPSAFTPSGTFVINNNGYYMVNNSSTGYVGYYAANFQTLANWKTANAGLYDQASYFANPNFRLYIAPDFYQPSNDTLNNKGANILTLVPTDILGIGRTSTPDLGAYEFSVPGNDAGISRITGPLNPISVGYQNVTATLKNYGTSILYSANIDWTVNTVGQPTYYWYGSANPGDTSSSMIGSYNFATNGIYNLKVWSSLPNTLNDSFPLNDTINYTVCTPLTGTLTINPSSAASTTNYTSFASLIQVLQTCGISGPVTVNVASGVYNQQLAITSAIPGLSGSNKLIFDGGDSSLCKIAYSGNAAQPATLLLSGVRNLVFRNFTFDGLSTSNAFAAELTNAADSNTFVKCTFRVPIGTTSLVNPFVVSGSLTSPTTAGNNANYILFDSCTSVGGYYGVVVYGNSVSPKGTGNIFRNSTMSNAYLSGMYLYYQNGITVTKNNINSIGINAGYTSPYGIYLSSSENGNTITKNSISNTLGGYGIYASTGLGNASFRQTIANNMIQIGAASYVTYGIYEVNNAYLDVVYNTVKLNTADASNAGGAMVTNNTVPATYTNVKIMNNIFVSPQGEQSIYVITPANVGTALYTIDNNVYYSTGTYPFRAGGFVTTNLVSFATGANMLGTVLPGNNVASLYMLPTFFSSTNLRSISPQLDGAAAVISTVIDDIDGNIRSVTNPDIGVYEFSKPANDAGAVSILVPTQPLVPGLSDVRVLIRNYGTMPLTSVDVSYKIGATINTQTFYNTIAAGNYDTVTFNSTSGPSSSSQQYNFTGGLVNITAWTSNPNFVVDSMNINDSTQLSICGGLSGNYTIDPAGSGSTNFTTIQSAIDKLTCGGVYGPVTFNIAAGTYTGQLLIPAIVGTSATNTILFKSATNNPASVTITSSTSTSITNYTINPVGLKYTTFRYITFQNANATYSRIIALNKNTLSNINCSDIEFRNCVFNGSTVASTADQYAIIYAPTNESPANLKFVSNAFNNGSIAITVSGPNVVNQNTIGLVADSNTFTNQYYAAFYLTNRFSNFIRKNQINLSSAYTASYGLYLSGVGQQSEISGNNIQNPAGTYGIYINMEAYYAIPGNLTIANNTINLLSTAASSYGISINNSSQIYMFNNTINNSSTSASSYGVYIVGNASFTSGATLYPASNNIQFVNNLVKVQSGYAFYTNDIYANAALNVMDYNLYYSAGTYISALSTMSGSPYSPANFASMKNKLFYGCDNHSLTAPIVFTSATNLLPSLSDSNSWALNGRGLQVFQMTSDYNGNFRSNDVITGAPDIGAFEFTPSVPPPFAVASTSPAYSATQYYTSFGDTIANVNWIAFGVLPNTFNVRYYSGTNPPSSTGYNVTNCYWSFVQSGTGLSYYYNLNLNYKPTMLGTVPSETNLALTSRPGVGSPWTAFYSSTYTLDTVARSIGTTFLSATADYTGTDMMNPLPIQLNAFNAKRIGKDALLDWKTASEMNSDYFVVERSFNGKSYEAINKLQAAGNSNSLKQYFYTDYNPLVSGSSKVVFYRLKMVDKDGKFEYSQVRMVRFDDENSNAVSVYPNPFNANIHIALTAENAGTANISVFNIVGKMIDTKEVKVSKGENNFVFDNMNDLHTGVYFIKINVNGTETVQKIVKE